MSCKMNISNLAEIKDSQIKSEAVDIGDRAKLTGVQIAAKKITIKSNAILTNCKLFSDGEITVGENSMIKEHAIINAFKSISIGARTIVDRASL